jgi:hypothetical protein
MQFHSKENGTLITSRGGVLHVVQKHLRNSTGGICLTTAMINWSSRFSRVDIEESEGALWMAVEWQ